MDERKLAEEAWDKAGNELRRVVRENWPNWRDKDVWKAATEKGKEVASDVIAAYGDARYKAGVEAMRDAAIEEGTGNAFGADRRIRFAADRLLEAK
jgi:hypothetical protein